MRITIKTGLHLLILCLVSASFARHTARGLSMGGAYSALARGVHAADWNPANLGFEDNPNYSFTIIGFDFHVSNNSFSSAMYNKYNGNQLDSDDIEHILDAVPSNGFQINSDASIRALSASYKNMALTWGADFGGYANMDKDFIKMALTGNEVNRDYRMDNIDSKAFLSQSLKFSYAHPVSIHFAKSFSLGASLSLMYGQYYMDMTEADMTLFTHEYEFDINGNYKIIRARGNIGWDFNLGAAALLHNDLTLSLAVNHVFSRSKWDTHVKEIQGYVHGDSLTVLDLDEQTAVQDSAWETDGSPFITRLPLELRLGAAKRYDEFLFTAEYVQAFKQDVFSSPVPRFSGGAEWQHIPWLPLRMGLLLGGRMKFGFSMGLGVQFKSFTWDFGMMHRGFILPTTNKGFIVSSEFGLYF